MILKIVLPLMQIVVNERTGMAAIYWASLRRSGVPRDERNDLCQEVVIAYWQTRGAVPWEDTVPQKKLIGYLVKAQTSKWVAQRVKDRVILEKYMAYSTGGCC